MFYSANFTIESGKFRYSMRLPIFMVTSFDILEFVGLFIDPLEVQRENRLKEGFERKNNLIINTEDKPGILAGVGFIYVTEGFTNLFFTFP